MNPCPSCSTGPNWCNRCYRRPSHPCRETSTPPRMATEGASSHGKPKRPRRSRQSEDPICSRLWSRKPRAYHQWRLSKPEQVWKRLKQRSTERIWKASTALATTSSSGLSLELVWTGCIILPTSLDPVDERSRRLLPRPTITDSISLVERGFIEAVVSSKEAEHSI